MTSAKRTVLANEAFQGLTPWYEAEDDGDAIRVSLDAIAALIASAAGKVLRRDDGLVEILERIGKADMVPEIRELYELAQEGEYGAGLSEESASRVNSLVQDVDSALREVLEELTSRRRKGRR